MNVFTSQISGGDRIVLESNKISVWSKKIISPSVSSAARERISIAMSEYMKTEI